MYFLFSGRKFVSIGMALKIANKHYLHNSVPQLMGIKRIKWCVMQPVSNTLAEFEEPTEGVSLTRVSMVKSVTIVASMLQRQG